jgi:hypothetical protein
MKCLFGLFTLILIPLIVSAQQSESDAPPDASGRCDHLFEHPSTIADCDAYLREWDAWAKANEAKKLIDDVKKVRSREEDQQIEGVIGVGKDLNTKGNNNEVSREVTDKGLGIIGQLAHQESAILDNIGETIQNGFDTRAGSPSAFNSSSVHQLVESLKNDFGVGSLQQQLQLQERALYIPMVKAFIQSDRAEQAYRIWKVDAQKEFNNHYNSPTSATVSTSENSSRPKASAPTTPIRAATSTASVNSAVPNGANSGSKSLSSLTGSIWMCAGDINSFYMVSEHQDQQRILGPWKITFDYDGSFTNKSQNKKYAWAYSINATERWHQNGNRVTWDQLYSDLHYSGVINGNTMTLTVRGTGPAISTNGTLSCKRSGNASSVHYWFCQATGFSQTGPHSAISHVFSRPASIPFEMVEREFANWLNSYNPSYFPTDTRPSCSGFYSAQEANTSHAKLGHWGEPVDGPPDKPQ